MKKIAVLPNMMTLGNLVCGFAAVTQAADANFELAAWLILFAMIFDALDGKLARMTNATSDFGAQLDSLADIVTFGVAPAFLVKMMAAGFPPKTGWIICALYVACTALRLAKFNVETGLDDASHKYFIGLPSPAAAGLVASAVILHADLVKYQITIVPHLLPFVTLVLAALMVSRFKYIHLLNILLKGSRPFTHFAGLIFLLVFVAITREHSLVVVGTLYAASGIVGTARAGWAARFEITDDEAAIWPEDG